MKWGKALWGKAKGAVLRSRRNELLLALDTYPGDAEIQRKLAYNFYDTRNYVEAIQFLESSLTIDKSRWKAWRRLGQAYAHKWKTSLSNADLKASYSAYQRGMVFFQNMVDPSYFLDSRPPKF